jgi:hypothetical protein
MGAGEWDRRRRLTRTSKSFERTRACRSDLQDSIAPAACRIYRNASCAELVERHGAEHREPLAEHLERHPHGALAALAADPGITGLFVSPVLHGKYHTAILPADQRALIVGPRESHC